VPATWIGGALYDNISPSTPFRFSFAMDLLAIAVFIFVLKPPKEPD